MSICSSDCDAGYVEYNGKCYKFSSTPKFWDDAQNICKAEGGDLISVDDEAENYFLFGLTG